MKRLRATATYQLATSPLFIILMLFIASMVVFPGCTTAKQKQTKQTDVVAKAKANIEANGAATVDKAKGQVFATGLALDAATNREPATDLAKDFNSRAQLTLGAPAYADATDYRAIVSGLLATNAATQAEARRALDAKDHAISALQADRDALRGKLTQAEAKRDSGYAKAAVAADKWARLTRLLKFGAGAIVAMLVLPILLKVVALAFPAMAPIASVVDGILGALARAIFRLAPKAAEKAEVVAQHTYSRTYEALADVVEAIQKAKQDPVVSARLKPVLLELTDDTTRPVIAEVKQELGLK